jgi:hypothetical protein
MFSIMSTHMCLHAYIAVAAYHYVLVYTKHENHVTKSHVCVDAHMRRHINHLVFCMQKKLTNVVEVVNKLPVMVDQIPDFQVIIAQAPDFIPSDCASAYVCS